jgi:PAS domain S-box-containing protein
MAAVKSSSDLPLALVSSLDKVCVEADLLGALGQAVTATDIYGQIVYWNAAAEALFGWPASETLGRHVAEFFDSSLLERNPEILKQIRAGKPWTGEVTVRRRDGEFLATILADRPIFDADKNYCGVVGVFTDVSNLKWMQRVMEEAVTAVSELNEKLRVVESLTMHDIRNKLAALNARTYLLKKRLRGNNDALVELAEIESASNQILRILQFEQIYVQVGSEELVDVDVETFVNEAAALFSDLKGAKLINHCRGLVVLADSMLRQLFYNLMDNTLKYGKTVKTISVCFEETPVQLKLIYQDDGTGISSEVKSHLFSEGYGKGTGYGLFLIKRICEAYGWAIEENGVHGEGARFVMTVPKTSTDGKVRYHF